MLREEATKLVLQQAELLCADLAWRSWPPSLLASSAGSPRLPTALASAGLLVFRGARAKMEVARNCGTNGKSQWAAKKVVKLTLARGDGYSVGTTSFVKVKILVAP